MPATLPAAAMPSIAPIHRIIGQTRWLLRSAWGATGLGFTAGTALAVLLVAALADMAVPLIGPYTRLPGLIVFGLLTAYAFSVGFVVPMLRRLGAVEIARKIESKIPGMHSRLVSCVDLDERRNQVSPAFYKRLVRESLDRIGNYRPASVVDFPKLRNMLVFAAVSGAVFGVMLFVVGPRFSTALNRVFRPFADIAPISSIGFSVRPGSTKVLSGGPILFEAAVTKGSPEYLRLELYGANGATIRYELENGGQGLWQFEIKGLSSKEGFGESFKYRVFGDGTWSPLYEIRWLPKPEIVNIAANLHYPEYLKIAEPKFISAKSNDLIGPDVVGPDGGEVEVIAEAKGLISQAEIQLMETRVTQTAVKNIEEKIWFGAELPEGAQPKGQWVWQADNAGGSKSHTAPPQPGPAAHGFESAKNIMPVGKERVLFTHVFIDPQNVPETIMLTWITDQGDAEHRAYWGANKIEQGQDGTAARRFMGDIPKSWIGQRMRLEVPAKAVNLQGAKVNGMYFTLFGGKAAWDQAGTSLPSVRVETDYVSAGAFPMQALEGNTWSGKFPLKGKGHYRVVLSNEIGNANDRSDQVARYEATADKAPEIQIDQPAAHLDLSKPQKVPLILTASDDYGLAEIILSTQREHEVKFTFFKSIKTYPPYATPVRGETIVAELDLTQKSLNLNKGDTIRYRVAVKDRRPDSKLVPSKEHSITISDNANAADRQLEAFEKSQDPFRDKLVQLISEQHKVKEKIDKVAGKYDALNEKIKQAATDAELKPKLDPKGKPLDSKDPANNPLAKLDPEALKNLAELRKELAELFGQEQKNADFAQQMANEMAQTVQRADQLPLLDPQIKDDLKELQRLFQDLALDPLKDLANQFQQGANPQQTPADLKGMKQKGDRLQNELQALKNRADALADAQRQARADRERAMAQLMNEMLKERGQMTARELAELKDFLKRWQEEMSKLKDRQMDLAGDADKAPDSELAKVEKNQDAFDHILDDKKQRLQKLMEQARKRRQRHPELPDDPFAADPKEKLVPPREQDSPDPEAKKDKDPNSANPMNDPEKKTDDDEPLFMPNFDGEKQKLDPRFKDKQRPTAKKKGDNANDSKARRDNLQDRQQHNLQDIDSAQKALEADAKSLEQMMRQLQQESQKLGQKGQQGEEGQEEQSQNQQSLRDMLQSAMMQKALRMAQRARQQSKQQGQTPSPIPNPNGQQPNLNGMPPSANTEAVLSKLDLDDRRRLLALPPHIREDIIQGMKEEGPEAYRKFIQGYFRQLNELQKDKK
jgi:hypothetical protein